MNTKKILSAMLAAVILLSVLSTTVFAAEKSGWYTSITVNGDYISLINNEYYEKYHDDLFESAYSNYTSLTDNYKNVSSDDGLFSPDIFYAELIRDFFDSDSVGKIGVDLYREMKNSDDVYYLSIYLNYTENFNEEKNNELLAEIDAIDGILYVGSSTPCAVIAVTGKNIDTVLNSKNTQFINYAFCSIGYMPSAFIPENGNRTFTPKASDARKILRYSAGMYDLSDVKYHSEIKEFFILSDTDFDGKITAADARTALRIAAGVEKGSSYTVSTDSFWAF